MQGQPASESTRSIRWFSQSNFGNETMQTVFSRDLSQAAQQRGTDPTKMLCVCHDHCHLRVSGLFARNVVGYAEQLA